jgi:TonB-linked SusC/RagA family outer membrane protein
VGTSTDVEGNFELSVPSLQDTLVASFVGYQTQEIAITDRTELDIQLKAQAIMGEEMVVVGYGEQKKENLTGSVSQIDSEALESRPVNNSTQALQGLAPNLNVDVSQQGGESDASMNLNIRGTGSLSSSDPYILIDGVRASQSEFSALNPNAIDNISVLKDAAAAAIYGAQAAYGVILVETKAGTNNQGFTINYSNSMRVKNPIYVPESVSSLEYAEVANTASRNFSGEAIFGEEQMDKMRSFIEGDLQYGTAPNPNNSNEWLGVESGSSAGWFSGYGNTDWWDVMYNDFGFSQKHDVSIQGGGDNATYYISGGLLNDPGQLKYGGENENYNKYNLNSNINVDVTDWLELSNITRYTQQNNIFPATLEGASRGRLYHDIMRFAPVAPYKTPPVEDDNGNVIVPEQLTQIAGYADNNGFNEYEINNFVSTMKAEVNITNNLTVDGDFTFKRRFYDRTLNYKKWSLLGPDGDPSITFQTNNNQIRKEFEKTNYTSLNIYSNYSDTFKDKHNLDILVGYQQEENNLSNLETARQGVITNDLSSINVATGNVIGPYNPISTWSTRGVFGRLTYNFEEKYLFEFNNRYDGSSRFSEGNRFGYFPSFSLGYNIHKENFWSSIEDYVNTLKLRGSWGKLGNQDVSSYLYQSNIPIQTRIPWMFGGERPNATNIPEIVSPNITWETSTTINIGADLTFLDNRLSTTIDVYERQTDNMFGPISSLPSVLGTSAPESNSASLKTRGWELSVNWQDQVNELNYNLELMLSDNKTTITDYNNPDKVISDWYEGQEMGEIWGYEANKLFQSQSEVDDYLSSVDLSHIGTNWQPGNVKYEDINGDGRVDIGENTVNNPGDRRIIGNNSPRYRFSIQTGVSWRNFDFSMMWQGVGKRDIWLNDYTTLFWGWNRKAHSRITEASMDYWTEDNRDAYLPIPLDSYSRSGFLKDRQPSTRYLQNGAYIRLKNLNLGYTLSSSITQKINIKSLRIFLSGSNLITVTNMWENLDPEMAALNDTGRTGIGRNYPISQVYSLGINISL